MDGTTQELIRTADEEFAALTAAVDGLDEPRMREVWLGTWGVREILAHVAGWHGEMTPALERLARGAPAYPDGAYDDADVWNARFVGARKDVATADLLREIHVSHRALLRAAASLGDAALAPGQAARALVDGVAADHYRVHAAQIRDWRSRAGH